MVIALLEIRIGEGFEKCDPPRVKGADHQQRDSDWNVAAVSQLGPGFLVVGLDRGPVLSEGELAANVSVGVTVGDVVDQLTHGPAALAIRSVELVNVQAIGGRLNTSGSERRTSI